MTYNYSGMSKFSNILVTGGAGYIEVFLQES